MEEQKIYITLSTADVFFFFKCSAVRGSRKCFCFTTRKGKKKNIASSSLNVTCMLLVGHFRFINECNNKSRSRVEMNQWVFLLKAEQRCTVAVNASLSVAEGPTRPNLSLIGLNKIGSSTS